MSSTISRKKTLIDHIQIVTGRTLGVFLTGATVGFGWGLVRSPGNLLFYPLSIGANCGLAAMPCFIAKEVIGDTVAEPSASILSGMAGGIASTAVYAGYQKGGKGAIIFGGLGLAMQQSDRLFEAWKERKRLEIIKAKAEGREA